MSTTIEKVGKNRFQARCTICGPIEDGSDMDFLREMERLHKTICPALKTK